jgi:AhpD family alkylhydroperoxidase
MADLFESLAARPELARTLAAHVRSVGESGLPPRTRELIALMVAWLNACDYCTCVHEEIALRVGVDEATLAALGEFATSEKFDDAERAALQAAVALTREPRGLPPALAQALRTHYGETGAIDVLAAIGLDNYLSRLTNALGLHAPSPAPPESAAFR